MITYNIYCPLWDFSGSSKCLYLELISINQTIREKNFENLRKFLIKELWERMLFFLWNQIQLNLIFQCSVLLFWTMFNEIFLPLNISHYTWQYVITNDLLGDKVLSPIKLWSVSYLWEMLYCNTSKGNFREKMNILRENMNYNILAEKTDCIPLLCQSFFTQDATKLQQQQQNLISTLGKDLIKKLWPQFLRHGL